MPSLDSAQFPLWLMQALCAVFLAILFLQSGLDKVIDWRGNYEYQRDHFAQTPLRPLVPVLFLVLTVVEVLAGLVSAAGLVALVLFRRESGLAFGGAVLAGAALTALFFGQRLAKDYSGAAGLVPYFLTAVAAVALQA